MEKWRICVKFSEPSASVRVLGSLVSVWDGDKALKSFRSAQPYMTVTIDPVLSQPLLRFVSPFRSSAMVGTNLRSASDGVAGPLIDSRLRACMREKSMKSSQFLQRHVASHGVNPTDSCCLKCGNNHSLTCSSVNPSNLFTRCLYGPIGKGSAEVDVRICLALGPNRRSLGFRHDWCFIQLPVTSINVDKLTYSLFRKASTLGFECIPRSPNLAYGTF